MLMLISRYISWQLKLINLKRYHGQKGVWLIVASLNEKSWKVKGENCWNSF